MQNDAMHKLQLFQSAAREGGFVEVKEAANRTVLWLKKTTEGTAAATPLMCIDSLTDSATVFWNTSQGN